MDSKEKLKKFLHKILGVAIAVIAIGIGFICWNQIRIGYLEKEFAVEGKGIASPYRVVTENDEYFAVRYTGYLDEEKYAVPKAGLQDNVGLLLTSGVLVCCEKGTYLDIPAESEKITINNEEFYLVNNVRRIVNDYNLIGIGFLLTGILFLIADSIAIGVISSQNKNTKK